MVLPSFFLLLSSSELPMCSSSCQMGGMGVPPRVVGFATGLFSFSRSCCRNNNGSSSSPSSSAPVAAAAFARLLLLLLPQGERET